VHARSIKFTHSLYVSHSRGWRKEDFDALVCNTKTSLCDRGKVVHLWHVALHYTRGFIGQRPKSRAFRIFSDAAAIIERTRVLSHVFVSVWLCDQISRYIEESTLRFNVLRIDQSTIRMSHFLITKLRDSRQCTLSKQMSFPARMLLYSRLSYPNIYPEIQMCALSRTHITAYYDKCNYALCKLPMYLNIIMKY
jgi:hypothetical protein